MCVLREVCFDDTGNRMANSSVLRNELHDTMFYLLEKIGFSIGMMKVYEACLLIDACLISFRTKAMTRLLLAPGSILFSRRTGSARGKRGVGANIQSRD